MHRRMLIPVVATLVAVTAACGGSDDPDTAPASPATTDVETSTTVAAEIEETSDAAAAGTGSTTMTTTMTTSSTAAVASTSQAPDVTTTSRPPDVTSTSGVGQLAESSSIVDLLRRLPLTSIEDPDGGRVGSAQITLADIAAGARLAGLPRPDTDDFDALVQWYVDLQLAGPVEAGGTGYWISGPEFPRFRDGIGRADGTEELAEFGFSPFAIDAHASVDAMPNQMAVFTGELDSADGSTGDLVEIGDGIWSVGDGADLSVDPAGRTSVRPLGRPHRVAQSDGEIAISLSTSLIEDWLAGGPSLADDPDLLAAAEQLDERGSVAAFLFLSDFEPFDSGEIADFGTIDVPFSVVGVGTAEVGGAPGNVIAYVFDDDDSAAEAVASIDTAWRDGELPDQRAPATDFFDIVEVEQHGRTVVVTAKTTDISTTRMPIDMVFRRDPRFTHAG